MCLPCRFGNEAGDGEQEEIEVSIRDKEDEDGKETEVCPRASSMVEEGSSNAVLSPGLQLSSESAPRAA